MSEPIYKVYMVKYTDAWYHLSVEEQQAEIARRTAALKTAGGETILMCMIPSAYPWQVWGVEKFPNMEAVQKHTMLNHQSKHYLYTEHVSYLGTEIKG